MIAVRVGQHTDGSDEVTVMVANHSGRRVSLGLSLVVVVLLMISMIPPGRSALASNVPRVQVNGAAPLDEIETLAYHEITRWETGVNTRGDESPIVSDDGDVIAFSRSPGTGDPATPNKVFVINADGSDEHEIDSYTPFCYCGTYIDLNGDGSRVVATDSVQVRVAETNGSGGSVLIALESNEINGVRISGDGNTVLFRVYRDTAIRDTNEPFERGLYAMNVDGSNLRQIVGPADMVSLLSVPLEDVPSFAGGVIDLSHDGEQIVFGMFIEPISGGAGQGLFAVNQSGGVPWMLIDRVGFILNNAISHDGSTVAYVTSHIDTGDQAAGVIGFDGSGERLLTTNLTEPPGIGMNLPNGYGERMQLNSAGSRLLLGSTGLLFDTASGDHLALAVHARAHFSGDPAPLVVDMMSLATMDRDAKRVVYLAFDELTIPQLAVLDINPDDMGDAPIITTPSVAPASIQLAGASTSTVTAKIATVHPFIRVGVNALLNGSPDIHISSAYYGPLADDGLTNGDKTAGDGVYTTDKLAADCCAVPGPRVLRIQAETKSADGYRHATAVNLSPFSVEGDSSVTVTAVATEEPIGTEVPEATATPGDLSGSNGTSGSTGATGDWSEWVGVADPADCTIAPVDSNYVVAAMNDALTNPPAPLIPDPQTVDELPTGEPVDDATTDAVLRTTWEVNACANAGDFGRLLALFTPDGLQRVIVSAFEAISDPSAPADTPTANELAELESTVASVLAAPPTPLDEADRAGLDEILKVEQLPDGRIMVVFAGDSLVASGQAMTVFELVGDRWLIAEMHSIGEDIQLTPPTM
jgi:Tol biopolymer transport system component